MADAWRQILRGELPFTHETATRESGGIHPHFTQRVIWDLCLLVPEVSGEQVAEIAERSLERWAEEDAGLGRTTKWTPEHFEAEWDAARVKAWPGVSELRSAEGALAGWMDRPRDVEALPWIVLHHSAYYVLRRDRRRYMPPTTSPLAAASYMREQWDELGDAPPLIVAGSKSVRTRTASEIAADCAKTVDRVLIDHTLHPEDPPVVKGTTMRYAPDVGVRPAGARSALAAELIDLLTGGHGADWISACDFRWLGRPCQILALVGPSGVGKSFLSLGIAQALGLDAPTPARDLFGSFNDGAERSCFFFADEGMPRDTRGRIRTEEVREMVTSPSRSHNPKGQPRQTVFGHVRLFCAANSEERIFGRLGSSVSAADRHAIQTRFILHTIDRRDEADLGDLCSRLALDELAGHCRWLMDHPSVSVGREGRFVLPSQGERMGVPVAGLDELLDALQMPGNIIEHGGARYACAARLAPVVGMSPDSVGRLLAGHLAHEEQPTDKRIVVDGRRLRVTRLDDRALDA